MLTRIEISGFKSFTNFVVDLAPLTIIAGANGSGKSNLFDALHLLGDLTTQRGLQTNTATRGGLLEAFTKYDAVAAAERMDVNVELLLDPSYGNFHAAPIRHTRFRYEISICLRSNTIFGSYAEIVHERLVAIKPFDDEWMDEHLSNGDFSSHPAAEFEKPLIDNRSTPYSELPDLHKLVRNPEFLVPTKLSEVSSSSDIHLQAVRDELSSLRLFDLNEKAHFSIQNGSNKHVTQPESIVLKRLIQLSRFPQQLSYLSNRVKRVIPEIAEIGVYTDEFRRTSITATDKSGRKFLAENLSEGTLRIISLATVLFEPTINSPILIEEPENGVDPRVLDQLVELLDDLTSTPKEGTTGVRQVICTTHSPTLLQTALKLKKASVLLAAKVSATIKTESGIRKLAVTRINPVLLKASEINSNPLDRYTLNQALAYLNRLSLSEVLTKPVD